MKKLLALLLALVMVISLAACGKDKPAGDNADASGADATAADTAATDEATANLPSFTFTKFGNAKVTIVGAEFGKDDYDEDFLRVYYDYTNNAEIGVCPSYTMDFAKVTQNGEEIEELYVYEDDAFAIPADMMSEYGQQPGVTTRCTALFACSPDNGIVEIGCYVMVGSWMYEESQLEWLEFQIDPDNMMGAPEDMEYPAITEPTYTADMATSAVFDCAVPFEVSLNGYEMTTYDGEPALRVRMTYTNSADDMWNPSVVLPISAYQDGVGLPLVSTWYLDDATEEDEAFELDLEPGQTVDCSAVFQLRNENPVEVVIEESEDYPRIGMVCDKLS